jgi:hypothetical protein
MTPDGPFGAGYQDLGASWVLRQLVLSPLRPLYPADPGNTGPGRL